MRQILGSCLWVLAWQTLAGTSDGKVAKIGMSTDSNVVTFTLEAAIIETPRCNKEQQFAFDTTKPGGQALLQTLLSAKEHDLSIHVKGRNICQVHWMSEDVHELELL